MRVSNQSQASVARFAPNNTKPLSLDTKQDAGRSNSSKAPKQSSFNLNSLKGGDFIKSLQSTLKPNGQNQVHEEALQAGVVRSILDQAFPEAGKAFSTKLDALSASGMPLEDSVKASLKSLVGEGLLNESDANLINGVSFRASQLDSNLDSLYDDKGGKGDTTIAVDTIENALMKASEVISSMQEQKLSMSPRELSAPSNSISTNNSLDTSSGASTSGSKPSSVGSSSPGSRNGFLWKPVSDSNGKLAVLLPSNLAGKVETTEIYADLPSNGGTPLDKGRFSGNANGSRDHFRFSKPGGAYPDGAYVVATLKDGSQLTFQIKDSSERNN